MNDRCGKENAASLTEHCRYEIKSNTFQRAGQGESEFSSYTWFTLGLQSGLEIKLIWLCVKRLIDM